MVYRDSFEELNEDFVLVLVKEIYIYKWSDWSAGGGLIFLGENLLMLSWMFLPQPPFNGRQKQKTIHIKFMKTHLHLSIFFFFLFYDKS